mmetsp:Transcript_40030/g.105942  ORF Transcript_40030/g.105942 Transcript_40030/m.105942 type:complete len:232 (+) Transcript_40030:57-752(+)
MVGHPPAIRRRCRSSASFAVVALCALAVVFAGSLDSAAAFAAGGLQARARPPAAPLALGQGAQQHAAAGSPERGSGGVLAGAVAGLGALFMIRAAARSADIYAVSRRAEGSMQPALPDAGIAVMDRTDLKAKMKEQFDNEKWWRVLLHNDDIHTFEYVTGCLTKTVQHLTRRKAYNITWEAHSSGKATVACVWKALAEQFCVKMQQDGLTVSIAPDSKFEGNKGGNGGDGE